MRRRARGIARRRRLARLRGRRTAPAAWRAARAAGDCSAARTSSPRPALRRRAPAGARARSALPPSAPPFARAICRWSDRSPRAPQRVLRQVGGHLRHGGVGRAVDQRGAQLDGGDPLRLARQRRVAPDDVDRNARPLEPRRAPERSRCASPPRGRAPRRSGVPSVEPAESRHGLGASPVRIESPIEQRQLAAAGDVAGARKRPPPARARASSASGPPEDRARAKASTASLGPAELVEQDPAERERRQSGARVVGVPAKDPLEIRHGLGRMTAQASGVRGQQQIGGVVAHGAGAGLP